MFKHYFKTAWRNLKANKLFTALNIVGLAIGLAVCILLFAYVSSELSFDKMYKNSKDIYRVNMKMTPEYNLETWSKLPNKVGPTMAKDIPQVKYATRLMKDDFGAPASLKVGDKNFVENNLYLAESSFFKIFDLDFVEGNAAAPFAQSRSVVISQSTSKRLFGNESALGKIIYVNNKDTLHVSGVYKDFPKNSVLDCNLIFNYVEQWSKYISWSNASFETYCLLQPNANIKDVEKQATALIEKNVKKEDRYYTQFMLQPLTKIHLYSVDIKEEGYSSRLGDIKNVKSLLFLSLLVLLIACINYMNLATARSQKRAKEVGVNKVFGANLKQMLIRFYTETGMLTLISVIIGYGLAIAVVPLFRRLTGAELYAADLFTTTIFFSLFAIWLIVTIVAGSYPAFYMSHISPLILMNKSKLKNSITDFIRKALVVFQFASSIVLIVAVIVIIQQIHFINNKNIGYDPKGVVSVSIKSAQGINQVNSLITELKTFPSVEAVSMVQSVPGDNESGKSVRKSVNDKEGYPVQTCRTDGSIVSTLGLKLLAGTTLPQTLAKGDTDTYVLINESVMQYLGFKTPQDAVGRIIQTEFNGNSIVSGVVENFNYQSLKNSIGGYVYYEANHAGESVRTLLIRYNTHNLSQLMQLLQNTFKKDLPNTAFDYEFLDQHVQNLYITEQHMANISTVFSLLAIIVACLGLFGLAAFTAEQRVKEIGIRKVLGASVSGITTLLTKDFFKLIIIAFIIAAPTAWILMNKWLNGFVYRISISWVTFLTAAIISFVIAVITISGQAIKAARANPVKSLKTE